MQQKNILEYLEDTVKKAPKKIAFSIGKESMSFGELYTRARSIGSFLAKNNIYDYKSRYKGLFGSLKRKIRQNFQ